MHKPQQEVFGIIKAGSIRKPNARISEIIKENYQISSENLLKTQKPILRKLVEYSKTLSSKQLKRFNRFMRIQECRLTNTPYIAEFSGKEFLYKVERICATFSNEDYASTIKSIATPLSAQAFRDQNARLPTNLIQEIYKHKPIMTSDKKETQLFIINRLKKIAQKIDRKDLINLCEISGKMVKGELVTIPFSNKSFVYDLVEVFDPTRAKPLPERVYHILEGLPKSIYNSDAFILKHQKSASEAIACKVLRPSISTIEHMEPKSNGGKNKLGNYALSCEFDNNFRSSNPMSVVINKYNKNNPQLYFNEIIEDVNKGDISPEDLAEMIETFERESHIKIDTSKLRG